MRKIKFRGKRMDNWKWVYGNLIGEDFITEDDFGEDYSPDYGPRDLRVFEVFAVAPPSIGQFTGLKDKKDKEIYEGDIMYSEFSDGSSGYSLIGWNEREALFGMMDAYSYQSKQEGYNFAEFQNYVLIAHLQKALICEVVGNIYDNPELLNVKKS